MVSITASIRDGRPHVMPPFKDKMTGEQIWQLAGYIQTIGAYSAKTGAPGRNDDKQTRPAENRAPASISMRARPRRMWTRGPRHEALVQAHHDGGMRTAIDRMRG
jgi:cytochrome c oxidase cbb3-type subunit 3